MGDCFYSLFMALCALLLAAFFTLFIWGLIFTAAAVILFALGLAALAAPFLLFLFFVDAGADEMRRRKWLRDIRTKK